MRHSCPGCKTPFARPLRPADAVGAAAYMQFCPHCLRELAYGAGLKIRLGLICLVLLGMWVGVFGYGGPVVSVITKVFAFVLLAAAWWFLPTFRAGPRVYDPETCMAVENAQNDSPSARQS